MERTKDSQTVDLEKTDQEIISDVLNGQKDLFAILMKRNNQRLFRAVRTYFKDEDEVTDVMQETYLKAFEKLSQFHGDAAFSTWLIRIGINESLLRLRKIKRKWLFFKASQHDSRSGSLHSEIDFMNPEKKAMQQETRRQIERAIDGLPEKYRVVYMLREVEGLSGDETARALGLSESNVKVRLFRAKAMMKKSLEGQADLADVFEFGNSKCDAMIDRVIEEIHRRYPDR